MDDFSFLNKEGKVRLHKSSIKPEGRSYFRVIADADLPEADSASESSDKDDFWNDTSASTLGDLSVYELMGVLGDVSVAQLFACFSFCYFFLKK